MTLQSVLILYGICLVLFATIELLWLGVVIKNFVNSQLGHLRGDVNWYAVSIFYALYPIALMIFAIYPAMRGGSVFTAMFMGALFGFFAYMTYELTNLSTLKGWPVLFVISDIIWGTILSGVAAGGTVYLYNILT